VRSARGGRGALLHPVQAVTGDRGDSIANGPDAGSGNSGFNGPLPFILRRNWELAQVFAARWQSNWVEHG